MHTANYRSQTERCRGNQSLLRPLGASPKNRDRNEKRQRSSAAIFSVRNPLDIPLHGEIEWGDIYWEYMPPDPEVFTFELAPIGKVEVTTDLDSKLVRPIYALRLYDLQGHEVLFRMDLLR